MHLSKESVKRMLDNNFFLIFNLIIKIEKISYNYHQLEIHIFLNYFIFIQ